MNPETTFSVQPGGSLQGQLQVPGDKSISHRAIIFGAIANGRTKISGLLEGKDVLATVAAFRAMGVDIAGTENGDVVITGVGVQGLQAPAQALNMGNSGTAMRLIAGVLVGQNFDSELIGDESLSQRPMMRICDPLFTMGAVIQAENEGKPPLRIKGGQLLQGINYRMPVTSAQVKSAILIAGIYARGTTSVTEPAPTRDHTERMLRGFGYKVDCNGKTISVRGGDRLTGCSLEVPGDISSAAFFLVGAAIAANSDLLLQHVGINATRIGIINFLTDMGADIEITNRKEVSGEPVADIRVRSSRLRGIMIPEYQVPLAIDEFPVLFIAAACAEGETVITGAAELRVKESDRIAVMAEGLRTLGIDIKETADGAIIQGGKLQGGNVNSHGDHRVAMAFAIAGLRASGAITIQNCANVGTSFPGFEVLARQVGLDISVHSL